jgi:hypothetical protein
VVSSSVRVAGGKTRCSSTGSTCHVPASSFVPEILPARTARRTVDLSKPQATAASARVYGMVVRLAATKRGAPWCAAVVNECLTLATGGNGDDLRRGLLRLWLVLSLCWMVVVVLFAWEHDRFKFARMAACAAAKRAQGADTFICGLSEQVDGQISLMSVGIADIATTAIIQEVIAYALIPPLVTLGVGLLGVWGGVRLRAQGCRVGRGAAAPHGGR